MGKEGVAARAVVQLPQSYDLLDVIQFQGWLDVDGNPLDFKIHPKMFPLIKASDGIFKGNYEMCMNCLNAHIASSKKGLKNPPKMQG